MTDHDEIRNLIARYSLCANNGDIEAYVALFASDGELVEGGMAIPRAKLLALSRAYAAVRAEQPQPFGGKHLQMNTWIEVDGDRARALTDLVTLNLRPGTAWTIGNKGRIADDIIRENGAWLFQRRVITWDYDVALDQQEEAFLLRLREVIQESLA